MNRDVYKCSRCGLKHTNLEFQEIKGPTETVSHFAECPDTGHPILMNIRVKEGTGVCAVHECPNTEKQGTFVGAFCLPCYTMITSGVVGPTASFLRKLNEQGAVRYVIGFRDSFGDFYIAGITEGVVSATVYAPHAIGFVSPREARVYVEQSVLPRPVPKNLLLFRTRTFKDEPIEWGAWNND